MKRFLVYVAGVGIGGAIAFPMHGLASFQVQIIKQLIRDNVALKSMLVVQDAEEATTDV